jgi:protein TonB
MKIIRSTRTACAVVLVTLAACSSQPKLAPPLALHYAGTAPQYAGDSPAYYPDDAQLTSQRAGFDSVDSYKYHAAQHIMRYNADHTFSGKLPPMLPAIVVLRITVDDTGRMTDVWVQRSIDDEASRVAVASMRRVGTLPRPLNLATGPGRSLSFSETFLFNDDYRYQIRTLAPIQTED